MSGILLSDDASSWYESGMCKDVTISNNVFFNNVYDLYNIAIEFDDLIKS